MRSAKLRTIHLASASRAIPTECVLVTTIGNSVRPASSIHTKPVISPAPLRLCTPAKTGMPAPARPRGWIAVTPVRTGPCPTTSGPSPLISVR
jgi:hypothetical protein